MSLPERGPLREMRVERPAFDPADRIIAVSDVHGNLPYFRGLTDRLELRRSDRLVLLGDLVEKGPESLAVLRYAMGLGSRCRLYPVLGNCDIWHLWTDRADGPMDAWVRQYVLARSTGLVRDMAREAGFPLTADFDMPRLKGVLRERFAPELDFLRGMPQVLDTAAATFVHGGLPEGVAPEAADPWKCLKWDNFYAARPHFDKWLVVGHTPVCLYGENTISAVPLVDAECRVASIDGGCVLKDDGQLNALILENGVFRREWYDPFPVCRALDAQAEGPRSWYIRWGDNAVEVLRRGGEFCRVRHCRTGYEMEVSTDFLFTRAGETRVTDCTDYVPAVAPGDRMAVVRRTSRGAWIKKDGVSGWYGGRLEAL